MVALARLRNTPNLPSGAMHLSEGDALIDPCVLPLSVIDCGAGGVLMMPGVLSRKKQLLPEVIAALS